MYACEFLTWKINLKIAPERNSTGHSGNSRSGRGKNKQPSFLLYFCHLLPLLPVRYLLTDVYSLTEWTRVLFRGYMILWLMQELHAKTLTQFLTIVPMCWTRKFRFPFTSHWSQKNSLGNFTFSVLRLLQTVIDWLLNPNWKYSLYCMYI